MPAPPLRRRTIRAACLALACCLLLSASGCRGNWVDATVENRTGRAVHELEVDYPSASFGADSLLDGAQMHYRFQIRGNGPVKVEYTFGNGSVLRSQGLTLDERQRGQLLIRLLPGGRAVFLPKLEPAS